VRLAVDAEASAIHAAASFAQGLVTGDPDEVASLAGTALGDLFVFGDIRARLALGEKAETVVLGLACIGLAITATYDTLGAEAPTRIGLSLVKAVRNAGKISAELAASAGRMMCGAVD
jgi:hypothetical protein